MKRTNGNTAVGRFKRVFSEQELNRLGKEVRYCQRERVVTPFRLVMAMLSTLSSGKVETLADSTRKVAMCAHHVMGALVRALLAGRLSRIRQAINNAVAFLASNARRAHPERDRRSGRLKLNLEPVFNTA